MGGKSRNKVRDEIEWTDQENVKYSSRNLFISNIFLLTSMSNL